MRPDFSGLIPGEGPPAEIRITPAAAASARFRHYHFSTRLVGPPLPNSDSPATRSPCVLLIRTACAPRGERRQRPGAPVNPSPSNAGWLARRRSAISYADEFDVENVSSSRSLRDSCGSFDLFLFNYDFFSSIWYILLYEQLVSS